jgi:predicted rRNA methylase YqxC with S4 and FtsJ domains
VREAGERTGLAWLGERASKLPGAAGNQEYFLHARKKPQE